MRRETEFDDIRKQVPMKEIANTVDANWHEVCFIQSMFKVLDIHFLNGLKISLMKDELDRG